MDTFKSKQENTISNTTKVNIRNEKELEESVKKVTEIIIQHMAKLNSYYGLNVTKQIEVENTKIYTDVLYFYRNFFIGYGDINNAELNVVMNDNLLSHSILKVYDEINSNKLNELSNLTDGVTLSEAVASVFKDKKDNHVYIQQSQAAKILGKENAYVNLLIESFEPKRINGRTLVRKDLVLERKRTIELKKDYKKDNRYMNVKEIADFLNLTTNTIYNYFKKEDEFKPFLEDPDVKYMEKRIIIDYKNNMQKQGEKFNPFDFILTKEVEKIFGVEHPTIHSWIEKGDFKEEEYYKGKVYLPVSSVSSKLTKDGYNSHEILEKRKEFMETFIRDYNIANSIVEKDVPTKEGKGKTANIGIPNNKEIKRLNDVATEKGFISYVNDILKPQILENFRRQQKMKDFTEFINKKEIKPNYNKSILTFKIGNTTYKFDQTKSDLSFYENTSNVLMLTETEVIFKNNEKELDDLLKENSIIHVLLKLHDSELFYNKKLYLPFFEETTKRIILLIEDIQKK